MSRTFYLRAWFDLPPLKLLVALHGVLFTTWLGLFIVQTRLIAAQNYRLHQKLGIAGAVLAALVVADGITTALIGAPDPRIRPMGLTGLQFLIFPLMGITFFGVCIAAPSRCASAAFHKTDAARDILRCWASVARLMRLVGIVDAFWSRLWWFSVRCLGAVTTGSEPNRTRYWRSADAARRFGRCELSSPEPIPGSPSPAG